MHLDRLAHAKVGPPFDLQSVIAKGIATIQPDMKPIYSLEEVVAVFCDPERFDALLEPQQQSFLLAEYRNNFAFAIHPKKAVQVLDENG